MRTIEYYNKTAQAFYDRSIHADLSYAYNAFLPLLPAGGHILDAGCGVGRDVKYFLEKGYQVTAFDGSHEMVAYAERESGHPIQQLLFQDMTFRSVFDGVWANASLIHVPYAEMRDVYERIYHALKPQGIFYGTYKYGTTHRPAGERDFYDMTEETLLPCLEGLFTVVETMKVADVRSQIAPSPESAWLEFIVRKR